MSATPNKPVLPSWDPAVAFQLLGALGGDYDRAAATLRIDVTELREAGQKYGWDSQLRGMGLAVASGPPAANSGLDRVQAIQRQQSRGLHLIQAFRLQGLVDQVAKEMMDPAKLAEATTEYTKHGPKRTFKPLVDLVTAANTAQQMASRALQDDADHVEQDKEALQSAGAQIAADFGAALDVALSAGKTPTQVLRDSLATRPPEVGLT